MDAMNAQLQRDVETLNAEAFAVRIIAAYCWIKVGQACHCPWAFALHLLR